MNAEAAKHPENSRKKRLTLIDGSGFIFRAYYALPKLTRADGTPTGAVYGFVTMMLKLMNDRLNDDVEDFVAVIFDAGRQTFRNEMYAAYKANRDEPPEDLRPQFSLVRDATRALGLPAIEMAGFEADDLIASYTRAARGEGMEVAIVSSDKDLMQLVDDAAHIFLFDAMKDKIIDAAAVEEKFGVPPDKVLEVLALMGDSSDNVPGVPGIGPKTAAELIGQYGDLETLLNRAGEIKQNKRRESLIEHAEKARLSRRLVTLKEDMELPLPLEALALQPADDTKLFGFVQEMGFKKIAERLKNHSPLEGESQRSSVAKIDAVGGKKNLESGSQKSGINNNTPHDSNFAKGSFSSAPPQGGSYILVQSLPDLERWITMAHAKGHVSLSLEWDEGLAGIALAVEPGEAAYLPLGHVRGGVHSPLEGESQSLGSESDRSDAVRGKKKNNTPHDSNVASGSFSPAPPQGGSAPDLFAFADSQSRRLAEGQLAEDEVMKKLAPLLADASVLKIGWRSKQDMLRLRGLGLTLTPVEDVCLISYCLGAGLYGHAFADIAEREFGAALKNEEELLGKGRNKLTFAQTDIAAARDFAAQKADLALQLWHRLKPRLFENKLLTVYERLERALLPILAAMEAEGVCIDRQQLHTLSAHFHSELERLAREIHTLAGREFTIGSPKQLGEILFEHLGIAGGKKSKKSGQYSTGAEVLEELAAQGHVIAEKVLEWRQYDKLRSTYSEALEKQIDPQTQRVHTTFQQHVAATGRLSSTDPNLQNIPIRTEQGKRIREAFVAAEGYRLLSADYSQIELRLLAEMANIETLQQAFRERQDIHAATASRMFGVPLDAMTPELRRKAKTINFGIIYGISAHGLAVRLGIDRADAARFIDAYFEHYPGIRRYMEEKKQEAREQGYVTSLFGRKIHIAGINDRNYQRRAFAERQAINAPLQGTSADIIKRAMVAMSDELRVAGDECRLLLQVHDELLFEIKQGCEEQYAPVIKKIMENAAHLSVPLAVETGIGSNWGAIH